MHPDDPPAAGGGARCDEQVRGDLPRDHDHRYGRDRDICSRLISRLAQCALNGVRAMAAKKEMDAVALLKADHRKVEELFEKFETARGN